MKRRNFITFFLGFAGVFGLSSLATIGRRIEHL